MWYKAHSVSQDGFWEKARTQIVCCFLWESSEDLPFPKCKAFHIFLNHTCLTGRQCVSSVFLSSILYYLNHLSPFSPSSLLLLSLSVFYEFVCVTHTHTHVCASTEYLLNKEQLKMETKTEKTQFVTH